MTVTFTRRAASNPSMKALLCLLITAIFLAPALARAQDQGGGLGLTDAQKQQIQQIRQSTTDKKERRQEIAAVLTPEQKAMIRQKIQERRTQRQQSAQNSAQN